MDEDIRFVGSASAKVLPELDSSYLLEDISPTQKVWFMYYRDDIVGGVKIDLKSGATGLEIIGPNVVIEDLSVESGHRGKGFGRALMQFAEDQVMQDNTAPNTISLAVQTDNQTAIALYKSMGYEVLHASGEPQLIDTDGDKKAYIMYKHLQPS